MATPDEYRAYADECLRQAEAALSEGVKLELLWLAELWAGLAEMAERYSGISPPD
jgi:hypothetical protein